MVAQVLLLQQVQQILDQVVVLVVGEIQVLTRNVLELLVQMES